MGTKPAEPEQQATSRPSQRVEIAVLGPTTVAVNGHQVAVTRGDRAVLTAFASMPIGIWWTRQELALRASPIALSARSIGSSIYRLRRTLGAAAILTAHGEVALNADCVEVDIQRLEQAHTNFDWDVVAETIPTSSDLVFATMSSHPGWVETRTRWQDRVDAIILALAKHLDDTGKFSAADMTRRRSRYSAIPHDGRQSPMKPTQGATLRITLTTVDQRTVQITETLTPDVTTDRLAQQVTASLLSALAAAELTGSTLRSASALATDPATDGSTPADT